MDTGTSRTTRTPPTPSPWRTPSTSSTAPARGRRGSAYGPSYEEDTPRHEAASHPEVVAPVRVSSRCTLCITSRRSCPLAVLLGQPAIDPHDTRGERRGERRDGRPDTAHPLDAGGCGGRWHRHGPAPGERPGHLRRRGAAGVRRRGERGHTHLRVPTRDPGCNRHRGYIGRAYGGGRYHHQHGAVHTAAPDSDRRPARKRQAARIPKAGGGASEYGRRHLPPHPAPRRVDEAHAPGTRRLPPHCAPGIPAQTQGGRPGSQALRVASAIALDQGATVQGW